MADPIRNSGMRLIFAGNGGGNTATRYLSETIKANNDANERKVQRFTNVFAKRIISLFIPIKFLGRYYGKKIKI